MRQSGVLAAAGLYALEHHVARLAEDHNHAQLLATGLSALGLKVEPPQTNILYVTIPEVKIDALRACLASRGILASIAERTRLVTHLDLPRADIDTALDAFSAVFAPAVQVSNH